jgi:hypothetical protein
LWYVVRRVGVQPIFTALSRVGFGFFIVVALNGLRHVLRTISMRISVPKEHRRFILCKRSPHDSAVNQ